MLPPFAETSIIPASAQGLFNAARVSNATCENPGGTLAIRTILVPCAVIEEIAKSPLDGNSRDTAQAAASKNRIVASKYRR